MKILFFILVALNFISNSYSYYVSSPTTVSSIISQTTTAFYTPPTFISTFFATFTPPTSVKIITETATPSTSVVVSITVANINLGGGRVSKMPNFVIGTLSKPSMKKRPKSKSKSKSKSNSKTSKTKSVISPSSNTMI